MQTVPPGAVLEGLQSSELPSVGTDPHQRVPLFTSIPLAWPLSSSILIFALCLL